MNEVTSTSDDLLYALDDRPPLRAALLAALGHLLAIVAGIATAPLLIARGLGLDAGATAYAISMALLVSGVATAIQILRVGPFGSGLLCIQGTSFAFIGAMVVAAEALAGQGLDSAATIGVLLGSASAGAAVIVLAGYFVERLSNIVTPNVTGITIFLLGLTLTQSAWNGLSGAWSTASDGSAQTLILVQALLVVGVIGLCATRRNPWLRLASISLGLAAGLGFAWATGGTMPLGGDAPTSTLPQWLPFPLGFDLGVFLILTPIFFVTMAESIGDLTATSMVSGEPISGPNYWRRVRGGVMGDGLNSVLASMFGTFPNTTFSQNNAVIALTGVASRFVGLLVAAALVLLGLLPVFAKVFQSLPPGVLYSATGLLFLMISLTGLRLLRQQPNQRRTMIMLIVCTVLAFALGFVPGLVSGFGIVLPQTLALLMGFPVAAGALLALLYELVVP